MLTYWVFFCQVQYKVSLLISTYVQVAAIARCVHDCLLFPHNRYPLLAFLFRFVGPKHVFYGMGGNRWFNTHYEEHVHIHSDGKMEQEMARRI